MGRHYVRARARDPKHVRGRIRLLLTDVVLGPVKQRQGRRARECWPSCRLTVPGNAVDVLAVGNRLLPVACGNCHARRKVRAAAQVAILHYERLALSTELDSQRVRLDCGTITLTSALGTSRALAFDYAAAPPDARAARLNITRARARIRLPAARAPHVARTPGARDILGAERVRPASLAFALVGVDPRVVRAHRCHHSPTSPASAAVERLAVRPRAVGTDCVVVAAVRGVWLALLLTCLRVSHL